MNSSPNIGALAAALAEARKGFKPIVRNKEVTVKTKTGGEYKFKYAPYEEMVDATAEALAAQGLSVLSSVETAEKDSALAMRLIHSSGEWIEARMPFPGMPSGLSPQELGSHLTYRMRYAYRHLLNLPADEDDDGNIAEGNTVKAAKPRTANQERGRAVIEAAKTPEDNPLKAAQRRTYAVLQRAGVLKLVDDPAAVLMPGDGGTFAREALRRKMMGDASFDKNKPADWLSWCLLLEKMVAENTPPTDVNEILA